MLLLAVLADGGVYACACHMTAYQFPSGYRRQQVTPTLQVNATIL